MDKIATCDIGSCSESLRAIWRLSLVPSATYSPGERVTSSLRSYERMGHRQHRRTRGAHGRGSMFGWRVRGARPTRLWGNTGGVLPVGCAFAGRGFRRGRAILFADDRQRSPDLRLIAVGDEKYKRESALRRPYEARLRLAATARHGRRCLNPDS